MLSRAPFVGIALFLMLGIVAGDLLSGWFSVSVYIFLILACILLAACMLFYSIRIKIAFGICFSLFLICSGCFLKLDTERQRDEEIRIWSGEHDDYYEAKVISLPEERKNSVRVEVRVDRVKLQNGKWISTDSKALISINSDKSEIPGPGDLMIIKGRLDLPMTATNPDQFDYRQYLRNKGILWTAYLQSHDYRILNQKEKPATLSMLSLRVSNWADEVFREHVKNDRSYGLVKAMLLGRRDDLGEEQVEGYIASGTVHILSVSGMHVAIIFLIISYLLGWMKRIRYGIGLYLISVISLLCFYAVATGLAPSVQRATIMCIVFVLAEAFRRTNNAMNTLSLSALLILIFDPSALYDVGFQLSYLAMSGIFLLYDPIVNIFKPENRILKFTWQVTAMSFAAQLATFPLSLYYFHQFPTYFWLVNPFVIAFTNVLLPAAMLLLLASLINVDWLNWLVGVVVDWSARLTDLSVTIPRHLPGYLVTNLHLGLPEVWLLYAVLFLTWYALHSRDYQYFKYAFALVFLFSSISISQSMYIFFSARDIIHEVPKHSVRSFKQGNMLYLVSDREFPLDTNAYDFYLKNYVVGQEIGRVVNVISPEK